MNKAQRASRRRFGRVKDFLGQHPMVGGAEELGKQSQELEQVLQKLSDNGEEQDARLRFTRAETARQGALRRQVWDNHMQPVSRIAKLVYGVPGMDRAFNMPKKRADNEALLDAARGMTQAAAKEADVFIEHGLPKDFLEQFRAATSALSDALGARVENQRRRTIANKAVAALVKRGNTAVQMLDAVVTPRLSHDPDLLAAWRSVKRLTESGGSAGGSQPAIPTTSAPIVAPAAPAADVKAA